MTLLLLLLLSGCSGPPVDVDPLVARGRAVYVAQCTSCHASDPSQVGPVGPAIRGSTRALVEERVLRAGYPAGYTPKRTTTQMVAMPQLAGDVNALAAFLK